ncbi:hypothetical protein B0H16DRAFT_1692912 [Mycena metata]|uniref:FCP1 homology domain-containing protein n=1 Tax=Mycena metata TaxID=1033252 RepID=A0AAD7ILB9_9AGAR|nr:hypothetical protein B0H16DRAFT_1692912 [Mycena metata]
MNYYGANQAMYNNAGYNYYELSTGADGFYVRDYSGYNGGYDNNNGYSNYGDYGNFQANYPQYPQYFPLQQPVPPRERTPTPPPPPAEPSPEYLATSLAVQPNTIPPGQRKLLIFDLNGTLLLRSPRHIAGQRKIYLRPYARALVAFIAHPQVRTWLDCMVWSSAQAHNVREMVERVFGAGEGAGAGPILRAVWARDTLGLGREAFHQKTQTTKDLAKPWAFFAAPKSPESEVHSPTVESLATNQPEADLPPSSSTVPTSSPPSLTMPILHWPPKQPSNEADTDAAPVLASTSAPQPPPNSTSTASVSASQPPPITIDIDLAPDSAPPSHPHGPETTLLVDDSPLKARLQPWNHLCVGEYDAPTRARDRSFARLPPDADSPSSTSRPPHANGVNGVNGAGASGSGHGGGGKYRKALDAELAGLAEEESATAAANGIGIVNGSGEPKVRKERWRKRRKEEEAAAKQEQQQDGADGTAAVAEGEATQVPPEASTGADASVAQDAPESSVPPVQNPSKRSRRRERKRRQAEAEAGSSDGAQSSPAQPVVYEPASGSGSSSPSLSPSLPPPAVDVEVRDELKSEGVPPPISPPRSDAESKKRKREPDVEEESEEAKHKDTATLTIEPPPMPADGEPYDPTLLAVIGVLSHVRSVGNVAAWVRSGGLAAIVDGSDEPAAVVQDAQIDTKEEEDGTAKEADAPTLTSNPSQWFTSRRILVAWAARGRAALAELGIDATPGVQ